MPAIRVNVNGVVSSSSSANTAMNKVIAAKNNVSDLRLQVDDKIRNRNSIETRLNSTSQLLGSIEKRIKNIRDFAESGSIRYQNTDNNVKTKGVVVLTSIVGIKSSNMDLTTGTVAQTKSNWWDNFKSGANDVYNVGKNAVRATGKVVSKIQEEIGSGGRLEGAWAAVKTTTKVIGASVLIATSAASIVLGNPMGVLGVVYGVNALIGAGSDLYHIDRGNYDKVGSVNLLKTGVQKAGEVVGENLGAGIGYIVGGDEGARTGATIGKSAGSVVGTVAYTAGGIYAAVSVGNTVVRASSGNIQNSLSVGNTDFTKMSQLTKFPKAYSYSKDTIEFVDAVASGNIISYATGKVAGEIHDGLSSAKYGEHGLSNEAMKEILREPGHATIEIDKAGISDDFIKKGFGEVMEHIVKPTTVK